MAREAGHSRRRACSGPWLYLDSRLRPRYSREVATHAQQAAYIKQWAETGRLLKEQRWTELARLDPEEGIKASDALIEAALAVPVPRTRHAWSGLVEQQAAFHRRRP